MYRSTYTLNLNLKQMHSEISKIELSAHRGIPTLDIRGVSRQKSLDIYRILRSAFINSQMKFLDKKIFVNIPNLVEQRLDHFLLPLAIMIASGNNPDILSEQIISIGEIDLSGRVSISRGGIDLLINQDTHGLARITPPIPTEWREIADREIYTVNNVSDLQTNLELMRLTYKDRSQTTTEHKENNIQAAIHAWLDECKNTFIKCKDSDDLKKITLYVDSINRVDLGGSAYRSQLRYDSYHDRGYNEKLIYGNRIRELQQMPVVMTEIQNLHFEDLHQITRQPINHANPLLLISCGCPCGRGKLCVCSYNRKEDYNNLVNEIENIFETVEICST